MGNEEEVVGLQVVLLHGLQVRARVSALAMESMAT
jgi:hypothetical protein